MATEEHVKNCIIMGNRDVCVLLTPTLSIILHSVCCSMGQRWSDTHCMDIFRGFLMRPPCCAATSGTSHPVMRHCIPEDGDLSASFAKAGQHAVTSQCEIPHKQISRPALQQCFRQEVHRISAYTYTLPNKNATNSFQKGISTPYVTFYLQMCRLSTGYCLL
jgi:hypothetical protein